VLSLNSTINVDTTLHYLNEIWRLDNESVFRYCAQNIPQVPEKYEDTNIILWSSKKNFQNITLVFLINLENLSATSNSLPSVNERHIVAEYIDARRVMLSTVLFGIKWMIQKRLNTPICFAIIKNFNAFKEFLRKKMAKKLFNEIHAISLEPTNLVICNAQKGILKLNITGKKVRKEKEYPYSSNLWLKLLHDVIESLINIYPKHPVYPTDPLQYSWEKVAIFLNGANTFTVKNITVNVEDEFIFDFNIEYNLNPNVKTAELKKQIKHCLTAHDINVKIKQKLYVPFILENSNCEVVRMLHESYRKVIGMHPHFDWYPSLTPAQYLRYLKLTKSSVVFGLGSFARGVHQNKFPIKSLRNFIEILQTIIRNSYYLNINT